MTFEQHQKFRKLHIKRQSGENLEQEDTEVLRQRVKILSEGLKTILNKANVRAKCKTHEEGFKNMNICLESIQMTAETTLDLAGIK